MNSVIQCTMKNRYHLLKGRNATPALLIRLWSGPFYTTVKILVDWNIHTCLKVAWVDLLEFHLRTTDTSRWSDDDKGGTGKQLSKFDISASRAKSMRVLLPLGLSWVNEGTTWVNEKLYNKSLRLKYIKWLGLLKSTLKSPIKRKLEK